MGNNGIFAAEYKKRIAVVADDNLTVGDHIACQ